MMMNFYSCACIERILSKLGSRNSMPILLDKRHSGQGLAYLVPEEYGNVLDIAIRLMGSLERSLYEDKGTESVKF